MADEKARSKKSFPPKEKAGGTAQQRLKKLAKQLSRELGKHDNQLTKEHKHPETTEERKKFINLKLKVVRNLIDQLDDVVLCGEFDGRSPY